MNQTTLMAKKAAENWLKIQNSHCSCYMNLNNLHIPHCLLFKSRIISGNIDNNFFINFNFIFIRFWVYGFCFGTCVVGCFCVSIFHPRYVYDSKCVVCYVYWICVCVCVCVRICMLNLLQLLCMNVYKQFCVCVCMNVLCCMFLWMCFWNRGVQVNQSVCCMNLAAATPICDVLLTTTHKYQQLLFKCNFSKYCVVLFFVMFKTLYNCWCLWFWNWMCVCVYECDMFDVLENIIYFRQILHKCVLCVWMVFFYSPKHLEIITVFGWYRVDKFFTAAKCSFFKTASWI